LLLRNSGLCDNRTGVLVPDETAETKRKADS
jgi:hypothetical protein